MRPVQIIFWSWLNVHAFTSKVRTQAWTDQRIALWKRTALPSIRAQGMGTWRYVLFCNPALRHLTKKLEVEFEKDPQVFIVYAEWSRASAAMVGEGQAEFRKILPEAGRYVLARLDSDDRYHPGAAAQLAAASKHGPKRPWLQFNRGYAHRLGTRRVYEWMQRSSPFYARVYGPDFRESSVGWAAPSHNTLKGKARALPRGYFVVTLHGRNTSTSLRNVGKPLDINTAGRVIRRFRLRR